MGTPGSQTDHGDGDDALRVILVGRTGLDAGLRRDADVELVRARTALEAVGEVADPIDGASPRRAAVIVAPEADPGEDAARFVNAVRIADPDAKVLLVENGGPSPNRAAYDGVLAPNAGATMIRSVVLGRPAKVAVPPPLPTAPAVPDGMIPLPGAKAPAAALTSPSAPQKPIAPTSGSTGVPVTATPPAVAPTVTMTMPPVAAPAAVQQAMAQTPVGQPTVTLAPVQPPVVLGSAADDLPLVQAALAGRDLVLPGLEVIRRRTGHADVLLTPAVAATPTDGVAVTHNQRVFGHLICSSLTQAELMPHAQWLATWLAVGEQQEALKRAALFDDLTGAYNRRYFEGFLREAIERARRERGTVTIMVFDVDDFKRFNDEFGHGAGDEILQQTVALLRSVIRDGDRVCRIGGDEFVVIFHEKGGPREPGSKPPTDVCQIAARFQKQIAAHRFPKLGEGAPGRLSISGGLATFPWDGRTPAELLERADQLALESKRAGKNCLTIGPGTRREFPA
ncbi:MAG: diguanylate cyclase domain-containing protein [Phycisphaerales bacterium]